MSEIPAGGERAFLDVLPLDVLPLHPKVIEELALLGVRRIGDLLALPAGDVSDRFGGSAAIAYAQSGQLDLARAEWETVLQLNPSYEAARRNLRRLEEMRKQ